MPQSSGEEGEEMLIPRRTGSAIVCASLVTGVQGDIGPQAWEETDSLPPNIRGPSGELLSVGRGRWRTLPSWLTRSTHRVGGVRLILAPWRRRMMPGLSRMRDYSSSRRLGPSKGGSAHPWQPRCAQRRIRRRVGRERGTTASAWMNRERGRQTRALGGLQQQEWTGDQQEGFSCNRQLQYTQR